MAAPTRSSTSAIPYATKAGTTATFSTVSANVGDVLILRGATEDQPYTLTVSDNTAGAITWTLLQSNVVASFAPLYIWKGVINSTVSSGTVTLTCSTANHCWGGRLDLWTGTSGVGVSNKATMGASATSASVTLAGVGANSAVDAISTDWSAATNGSQTWGGTTSGTADTFTVAAGLAGFYEGKYADEGASGSKTITLSPMTASSGLVIAAVEITGLTVTSANTGYGDDSYGGGTYGVRGSSAATNPLAGTISSSSTFTGAAVATKSLGGTIASTTTFTGNAPSKAVLAGTIASATTFTGDATSTRALAGTISSTSTFTGDAIVTKSLAGTIASTSTFAGNAPSSAVLVGTIASATTFTGAVTDKANLVGTIASASTFTGATALTKDLAGTIASTSSLTGAITAVLPLAGTISATSSLTGTATNLVSLAGTSASASTFTGAVTVTRPLVGRIVGTTYYSKIQGQSNIAGHWRFGELSGTNADDPIGGFDGTYTGGFALGQPSALAGDSDTAVGLNGTTGYVAVPASFPTLAGSALTLMGWMRTTDLTKNGQQLFGGYDNSGGSFPGWGILFNNDFGNGFGRIAYYSSLNQANPNFGWVESPVGITDTNWHHIAITVTSGGAVSFYVDGVLIGTATSFPPATWAGAKAIGATAPPAGNFFKGDLDEFTVLNSVLSSTEIADYNNRGRGLSSGLTGSLTDTAALAGTISSSSTLTGAVTVSRALTGTIAATSSLTAALTDKAPLVGTIASTSTLAGTLSVKDSLVGTIASSSTLTGALTVNPALAGNISSASSLTSTATVTKPLAGTIASTSTFNGILTNSPPGQLLAGLINVDSTFSGNATTAKSLAGTIGIASSLTGTGTILKPAAGSISGLSTLTAIPTVTKPLTGTITASSTFTGNVKSGASFTGAINILSVIDGTMSLTKTLSGTIGGAQPSQQGTNLLGLLRVGTPLDGSVVSQSGLIGDTSVVIAPPVVLPNSGYLYLTTSTENRVITRKVGTLETTSSQVVSSPRSLSGQITTTNGQHVMTEAVTKRSVVANPTKLVMSEGITESTILANRRYLTADLKTRKHVLSSQDDENGTLTLVVE